MIGRLIIREFWQGRGSALLKVAFPSVIVAGAGMAGYAGAGLAMILIFAGVISAGMGVMRLKTCGMYDRLIASPAEKPGLFLEITGAELIILSAQYLPAAVVAAWYSGLEILLPALLSLLGVGIIGVSVGIVSRGIGDLHLIGSLAVIPLLLAAFSPFPATGFMPFHLILDPGPSSIALVVPALFLLIVYIGFAVGVSRL